MVYRLVYISSQVRPLQPAESERLLTRAGRRNAAAGVTGALLDYGGYFLQVLEGPRAVVEQTFERIRADRRHHQLVVVDRADDRPQRFERWSMIRVDIGPTRDRAVESFLHTLALAPQPSHADAAVELLAALAARSPARPGATVAADKPTDPAARPHAGPDPLTPPSRA
jgi:hypothetical protein